MFGDNKQLDPSLQAPKPRPLYPINTPRIIPPPSTVLALYGISAASSSSKNQEGIVWVPGVMKGASVSKRVRVVCESRL